MKDDLDRWIDLEGPEPDEIRELLDTVCELSDVTPEQEARLGRSVLAAVADDRRRRDRRRILARVVGGGLVAACLAGAILLAIRLASLPDLAGAQRALPNAARPVTEEVAKPKRGPPPVPPSALPDAGPGDGR